MRKRRKYIKRDYTKLSTMDVYNLVRDRELKKFPNNYLDKDTIKEIVRHVFLKELKLTRKDIISLDHKFFMELNMGGFRKFFDMKEYKLLSYCFPEMDIRAWELRKVEPQFWEDKENQKEFILWAMAKEGINPYSKEDLRRFTARSIIRHGGSRILKAEDDIYTIIAPVIDYRFKEWEIMKVRAWKQEKIIAAVKWLVEEKMHYTMEQACTLKVSDFKKYNLDGMLQKGCNHSILYALNLTYGDIFTRDSIRGMRLKTKI